MVLSLPTASRAQEVSPQAELESALEILRTGEIEQAESLLEDIVARWPNFRQAHFHLGRVAFEEGELELARTYLTTATEGGFPNVFSAWYYLGRVLLREEKPREAAEALDRSIEMAPGFAPASLERGRARLELGDAAAGLEDLMAVLENPQAPHDTRQRARRLSRRVARDAEGGEDLWQALEIYQQLLDTLGKVPAIDEDVARVAQTMGAQDLASCAAYQEAMAREPRAAEAVRSFALSSLTTEQYDGLRQVLESHIEAYPENLNTLYSLGVMSLRDNRLADAEEYLLRLSELAPDHRQVHYSLGQLYLRQGDTDRGQAEMKRFAEIKEEEDQEWEHHNQAHFRRVEARKAVEEGRPGEAAPLYEQSIADGTAEVSDYLELAEARQSLGEAREAIRRYEGVLSSFPYNRNALEGLLRSAKEVEDSARQSETLRKLQILDWPCDRDDR